jgi:hypothetical protein
LAVGLIAGLAAPAAGFASRTAAAQVSLPTNARSGLLWPSGANGAASELEAYRNRPLDVRVLFFASDSWNNMVDSAYAVSNHTATGARLELAIGLLPETHRGQHAACAAGDFDASIRQLGQRVVAEGAPNAVLRLGWEANRRNGYPWAAVDGRFADYIGCWRRWVSVLRALPGQTFVFAWVMQDKSSFPAADIYPGNEWVDVIGVNPYDRCPPVTNDTEWHAMMNLLHGDGVNPRGPHTWLRFARSRGKKFAVAEWGVGGSQRVCDKPGFDNPFYVRKMHAWMTGNAGMFAYESYFNAHGDGQINSQPPTLGGSHRLAPTSYNPQAAAEYKRLFGRL